MSRNKTGGWRHRKQSDHCFIFTIKTVSDEPKIKGISSKVRSGLTMQSYKPIQPFRRDDQWNNSLTVRNEKQWGRKKGTIYFQE